MRALFLQRRHLLRQREVFNHEVGSAPTHRPQRTDARNPGSFVMDIRFSKVFDFGRPGNLEALFEIFNLFNNANRLSTNTSAGSPNLGFLNIVGAPRQIQLGVRYRW